MLDPLLSAAPLCALAAAMAGVGAFWWGRHVGERRANQALSVEEKILSTAGGGYYYHDFVSGRELVSGLLRDLMGQRASETVDADVPAGCLFPQLRALFDDASFAMLENALRDCQEGRGDHSLLLKSRVEESAGRLPAHRNLGEGESANTSPLAAAEASFFRARVHPVMLMGGVVTGVVIWLREVTKTHLRHERQNREHDALKQEIRNISTILSTLSLPIWRRSRDLSINYCNLAYSEIVEESPEAVVESEELELYRQARQLAKRALETGAPAQERKHVVVGGARRLYEVHEVPVDGGNYLVGYAQDITYLEQANEEIRRYVSAQADLLESSTSAMAIYGADLRLKSYNYAFVALWRLDEDWLDSEPTYGELLEVLREKRKLPEQANFPAFKQQQVRLFTDLIEPREEFFYLPDGKTLRVIAIPHAMGGVLFAYEDVTDRLALERSYNTLIAVQKETLNRLTEGVAVFGEDGRLKLSNPTYLTLWQLDEAFVATEPHVQEVLERTRHLYVYEDWDQYKKGFLDQAHSRATGFQRMERSDGSVLEWGVVPLPDGATLLTFSDVTAAMLVERSLREKNEALEAADRLKTEFLASVSYELRSPLTSISGFAEMLRQNYFGALSQKQREYVEGIHQSSQQLMHLINNILDLASIEAGYMRLEVTRCKLHGLLHAMYLLVRERARAQGITIKLECSAKIGEVLADENRIKQVVFNLLSNAIKYTPKGGKVLLGALEKDADHILLWVEDTGVGIPDDEQAAVFGTFRRGATAPATKSGAGLGLPMVKNFIELHGGTVDLSSIPGQGTKVLCTLPRHNKELEQYMLRSAV